MLIKNLSYKKIKKKYLKYLKSQEVLSEPFRDKISQLNKFYLPISQKIQKDYPEHYPRQKSGIPLSSLKIDYFSLKLKLIVPG